MKAVIIEDEIVAAQALQSLIHEVDAGIEILAVLQSIEESVEWFESSPHLDLMFMDIHLADGSAFNIFRKTTIPCPIIFTTAYDEYALNAFEVNSIDYILKPIDRKDLQRAINKYRNYSSLPEDNNSLIIKLMENIKQNSKSYKSFFLVPFKDKLIPLATGDITCVFIDKGAVKALTISNQSYSLDRTLDDLMQQLDPALFYRANRQYIVARQAIKDISIWFGGKLSLNLAVPMPEKIIVSKARSGEFKKWFTD